MEDSSTVYWIYSIKFSKIYQSKGELRQKQKEVLGNLFLLFRLQFLTSFLRQGKMAVMNVSIIGRKKPKDGVQSVEGGIGISLKKQEIFSNASLRPQTSTL